MRGWGLFNVTNTMVSLSVLHKGLECIVEKLKSRGWRSCSEDTVHTPFNCSSSIKSNRLNGELKILQNSTSEDDKINNR